MGKGKKQKKSSASKQEEPPSVAGLTLEEPAEAAAPSDVVEPSTSSTTAAPPPEEEEGGLGLGPSKSRKKKKPATAAASTEVAAPSEVAPAPPAPTPAPEPETKDDDDEGGLGLGLGKSRNKKKRKPKSGAAAAAGDAGGSSEQSKESTPAPTERPTPIQSATGWGTPKPTIPAGIPAVAPPGFPAVAPPGLGPPQSQFGPPLPTAPSGFPAQYAQPAQAPPQGFPGLAAPRAQSPPQGFPGLGAPQAVAPVWQQPKTPAGAGRGQGRGQAPQAAPAVTPGATRPAQQVTSHGDVRRTPDTTVSRFKIPDKIIGNSVPARPINVLANYLPMTIKALKIHRYDVSFKPDKPKKMIPKAFIKAKERHYPREFIAFDQMKNCYSLKPLPNVTGNERFSTVVELADNNGRKINFEVSFKSTGVVDLGTIINHMKNGGSSLNPPTEAIQCVDVILRQGTLESYIKAGRQFFKRPEKPINLGDGLEMWTGLFQSAIFTCRPFINIDVAHKGFPKQQKMIDALRNDFNIDVSKPIPPGFAGEKFKMFIKNLRVMASIGGDCSASGQKREFICNELVDPPNRIKFTMTDDKGKDIQMTVADYFTNIKKVRLQYPNLNCMWVGPRDKKIYYPLELLEVSYGQALNKQLNETQLSTMVRQAASPPDDRKRKIEEVIRDMNYSRNEYFKAFGMEIKNEFIQVEAKVLQPPNLDVGDRLAVKPVRGAWQTNRLLKPEPLESWAIISIETDANRCGGENLISLLKNQGQQMGMRVAEPRARYYNIQMQGLRNVLFEALQKEIRLLVVIVSTRGHDYYHRVKKLAERDIGILTQCIKEFTAARKMNPQTAKNILLKVNSKLMGINQALHNSSLPRCLQQGGVMVVGADVTHPSPDQTSLPSIAAVTASIDQKAFMYNIQLSIQTPKKEMIVEFEDMMVEHLKVYRQKQGALPRKFYVFRDGVSEGQFAQVMESELQAVHRAYQRMTGTSTKPEVLFLLVQKRHHTRFFNSNPATVQYNVEPGTVVDKHIVHAKELDFYLLSHAAIKGTARPTRYHAVCNDGKIPHDEVEQLTYYLCHLYSRCMRAVSYPTPTYYAHLACLRARSLTYKIPHDEVEQLTYYLCHLYSRCMRAVSYPTPTYYAHLACLRARSLTYGEKFNNQDLERNPRRLNVLDKMLDFSRMFFV
ncbi:piwi domain-containing protein [Phthorimaea operculella]|nr:piwi domain-containing protein [Phthorimaea operculella]